MVPVRCPHGHASETDDFCDECGAPIPPGNGAGGGLPSVPTSMPHGRTASPPVVPATQTCPWCGATRTGRFCEEDGFDFVAADSVPRSGPGPEPPASTLVPGPPSGPASGPTSVPLSGSPSGPAPTPPSTATRTWVVVVEADRRYYDSVVAREGPDIAAVSFPNYYPREEVALDGAEVRVGRRRAGGTGPAPQVDLAGPPLDPGVSHRHAVLLPHGIDGWAVLDPGSTNGTTINYAADPIPFDTPVPLSAGDRVHVGAFTTLSVEHR